MAWNSSSIWGKSFLLSYVQKQEEKHKHKEHTQPKEKKAKKPKYAEEAMGRGYVHLASDDVPAVSSAGAFSDFTYAMCTAFTEGICNRMSLLHWYTICVSAKYSMILTKHTNGRALFHEEVNSVLSTGFHDCMFFYPKKFVATMRPCAFFTLQCALGKWLVSCLKTPLM